MIPLPWAVTTCTAGELATCAQPCGGCIATLRKMGHKPVRPPKPKPK